MGPVANGPNGMTIRKPTTVTEIILKAYRRLYGGAYYLSAQQIHGACFVIWNSIN